MYVVLLLSSSYYSEKNVLRKKNMIMRCKNKIAFSSNWRKMCAGRGVGMAVWVHIKSYIQKMNLESHNKIKKIYLWLYMIGNENKKLKNKSRSR